jgi:hypothetical protein
VSLGALDDAGSPPTERSLAAVLGRARASWTRLRAALQAAHGPLTEEWYFAGKAFGWSFRLRQGKRVLVYMLPCRSHFLASFALGEAACRAARTAGLSAPILALLDAAPKYAEGRGVRITVRTRQHVDAVLQLAALKAAT